MFARRAASGAALSAMICALAALAPAPALADSVPPETTITSAPAAPVGGGPVPFSFTADEAGSTFQCRVDGMPWATCQSPYRTAPQTEGEHRFAVVATDVDRNTDPTPATADFVVDKAVDGANAAAPRRQRLTRQLRIPVTVTASEEVRVSARGAVRAGGRRVALVGASAVPAGETRKILLRPRSKLDGRRIRRQVRRRGPALARITATFTDSLGNVGITGEMQVRLKR